MASELPMGFAISADAAYWTLVVWFFLLGSVVGSFLNVVIYRLPAGMSIVRPGSHCPLCGHAIRWYDNIPVLGWIVLRGHCRDCRAPISIRYPLIEAACGMLFLAVAMQEILSEGLPEAAIGIQEELAATQATWQAVATGGFYLVLLTTLLAAAIIEYDGKASPRRLFLPVLVTGLVAPLFWPWLYPLPAEGTAAADAVTAVRDGMGGMVTGLILGQLAAIVHRAWRLAGVAGQPRHLLAGASTGLFLGWQAVLALAIAATVADAVSRYTCSRSLEKLRISWTAWLGVAALAWILSSNTIAQWIPRF